MVTVTPGRSSVGGHADRRSTPVVAGPAGQHVGRAAPLDDLVELCAVGVPSVGAVVSGGSVDGVVVVAGRSSSSWHGHGRARRRRRAVVLRSCSRSSWSWWTSSWSTAGALALGSGRSSRQVAVAVGHRGPPGTTPGRRGRAASGSRSRRRRRCGRWRHAVAPGEAGHDGALGAVEHVDPLAGRDPAAASSGSATGDSTPARSRPTPATAPPASAGDQEHGEGRGRHAGVERLPSGREVQGTAWSGAPTMMTARRGGQRG